jgi:mannose-1-phosphate guanylyltransferase
MFMRRSGHNWALLLATGEPAALDSPTVHPNSSSLPRQFSSVDGIRSLLDNAIERAHAIASRERLCIVIGSAHRRHWQRSQPQFTDRNIIEQPRHRGTANDILLAVLNILDRDPWAQVVVLPTEHYVRDELALVGSLSLAATANPREADDLVLIGIEPDEADDECDYIVPGRWLADGTRSVQRVIDRSEAMQACDLLACGALWDSHIFAARAVTLLGLLRARLPDLVDQTETALACDMSRAARGIALSELYERIPSIDFSRAIIQRAKSGLRVIPAPNCGWADLSTAQCVAATSHGIVYAGADQEAAPQRRSAQPQA